MKIAAGVEYCGRGFYGWQRQRRLPTIQAAVEQALSRVAATAITVHCAGRTDTGVHASGQVIHFNASVRRELHAWVLGGNTSLPGGISLCWAQAVDDDFHARFSALSRTYRYVILNRRARPGLLAGLVTWECRPLDAARMAAAATALLGEHDFTSYRALECQARSPVRNVHRLEIERCGEFIVVEIEANAFLHHMVRNIAGVLIAIGSGRAPADWAATVLAARDRSAGGVTAPADGLYLKAVNYPPRFGLPPVAQPDMFAGIPL